MSEKSQAFNEVEVEQDMSLLALSMDLNKESEQWRGITILYKESKEPTNFMDPFLEGFEELQSGCFHAIFTNFHPQMFYMQ